MRAADGRPLHLPNYKLKIPRHSDICVKREGFRREPFWGILSVKAIFHQLTGQD